MSNFKDICDNCRPYLEILKKEIDDLKKRLQAYENAHTPPSKKRFPNREKSDNPKKNGRPKGYPGTTRKTPTPDRTVNLTAKKCPYCRSRRIRPKKVERRIIEDIPTVQTTVAEFLVNSYECDNCKREFETKHKDLPENGNFGNNLLAHVSLMKYHERVPYRKIREALKRQYGLEITHSSILDFTHRVSMKVRQEYDVIFNRIRLSDVVYVDETSIKVDGSNYWIWTFVTADDTMAVVRSSRGGNVLEEVLGADYRGVVVCDGWRVYPKFTVNLQRCWAHLLREAKFLARNTDEGILLSRRLHDMYRTLTTELDTGPPDNLRSVIRMNAEETMRGLLKKNYQSEEVQKFISKIENGFDHWFTFVTNPLVEPTNNRAENALREHVVHRKIIGTLRNEKGTFIHETMMSVLATWDKQGYNTYEKLVQVLRS